MGGGVSLGVLISRAALPTAPPRAGGRDVLADSGFPSDPKARGGPKFPVSSTLRLGKPGGQLRRKTRSGGVECAGLYVAPAGPWSRGVAACQGCRSVSENSPSPAGICSPAKRRLAVCLPLPGFLGPSGASGGLPSLCPYETQGGLRMPGRSFSQARAPPRWRQSPCFSTRCKLTRRSRVS